MGYDDDLDDFDADDEDIDSGDDHVDTLQLIHDLAASHSGVRCSAENL